MSQSAAMFVVGALLVVAGGTLWLLQRSEQRREKHRELERLEQTPFPRAEGHQQTQTLRRRWGL